MCRFMKTKTNFNKNKWPDLEAVLILIEMFCFKKNQKLISIKTND